MKKMTRVHHRKVYFVGEARRTCQFWRHLMTRETGQNGQHSTTLQKTTRTPQWCHHCTGTPPTEEGQTSRIVWHCGRPGGVKKGRAPSCARATAARVWWSLRVKSGAGGLKRPRRSCGRGLAPRRRQCRDGCRRWACSSAKASFWARSVLLEQETRCRQSTRWRLTPVFWCSARALVQDRTDTLRS